MMPIVATWSPAIMEAVTLFDNVAKDATDAELKAFAAKALPTPQMHGGKAKVLKSEFCGIRDAFASCKAHEAAGIWR